MFKSYFYFCFNVLSVLSIHILCLFLIRSWFYSHWFVGILYVKKIRIFFLSDLLFTTIPQSFLSFLSWPHLDLNILCFSSSLQFPCFWNTLSFYYRVHKLGAGIIVPTLSSLAHLHAKVGLPFSQLLVRMLSFHKKMLLLSSILHIIKTYKFATSQQLGIFINQIYCQKI